MTAKQTTPGRSKGAWRRLVPFTAFLFVFGMFGLVWGALRWENVPYLLASVINLGAGAYFVRDIQRRRRAEREAAVEPGPAPDSGGMG
jgi:hypothetical protein